MRGRRFLGIVLVLHGLGHSAPGMWAAGRAPVEPVAVLWWVASLGFVMAGFRLLRWPAPRFHPVPLSLLAAAASLVMLAMARAGWPLLAGVALDLVLPVLVMRFTRAVPVFAPGGERIAGPALERRRKGAGAWHRVAVVASALFMIHLTASILLRPWHMSWGATGIERGAVLPGDDLVPGARYVMDHAIVIHAPVSAVWPWLAQVGQDRAGFYSYDWIERLIGADIHNIDSIVPAWQHREIGELVPATQAGYLGLFRDPVGWRVLRFDAGRALVLENWGSFVLHPVDSVMTILHIRTRGDGTPSLAAVPLAPFGLLVFEPAHFIMERGMLRGIKRRAEQLAS